MEKILAPASPNMTALEKRNLSLSRSIAGDCVVLLENDGTLPLKKDGRIALFGMGARETVRGGTGSGSVNSRTNVNIETGLKDASYTITTTAWLDRAGSKLAVEKAERAKLAAIYAKEHDVPFARAMRLLPSAPALPPEITEDDMTAFEADTCIYVISRNSGESRDRKYERGDYLLLEEERDQLTILAAHYEKLIVVLNIGGVIDMTELLNIKGVNAILLMSQLGSVGGDVLADILCGRVNPSGKLTDTWAKNYWDYPSSAAFGANDGDVDDEYYTEGIYVGYRYFDTFGVEPVYPFGYGKSYTSFVVSEEAVSVEGENITVTVRVTNTGSCSGKEVVQVYVSAPEGIIKKPYQVLVGFRKTGLLAPGESEEIEIIFPLRLAASYYEKYAMWVLEKGRYIIRVGTSSRDTRIAAAVELDETAATERCKNLFADPEPVTDIEPPERMADSVDSVPVVTARSEDIAFVMNSYTDKREPFSTDKAERLTLGDVKNGKCTLEELISQLTVEEMAELAVGALRAKAGSVIGNASYSVPGAAGDTSAVLKESRGVRGLILADGPAGLRLQPVFKTDKEGNKLPGGAVMDDAFEPFDPKYTAENSDTYYQYCTAIPIGWALAQSWDTDLARTAGDIVGSEMDVFGIDLWLAPALNIHRNPLCGRNFEYFSEDPLISGKMAAAITDGVQRHSGRGATIKHYAANNQEDNRRSTNAHISERAIREIYIKGFEIAVKESKPLSIMTSYNLLNGIHTANSYDLISAVARDEWGFDGSVMTDWYTSVERTDFSDGDKKYGISASAGCIWAGNDLQMPGASENVDDIIRAVTSGAELGGYRITRADLEFCTYHTLRTVLKCDECRPAVPR